MDAAYKGRGINGPISAEPSMATGGRGGCITANKRFGHPVMGKHHILMCHFAAIKTEKKEMRVRKVSQSELAR